MLVEPLDNGLSKYTPQCLDAVVAEGEFDACEIMFYSTKEQLLSCLCRLSLIGFRDDISIPAFLSFSLYSLNAPSTTPSCLAFLNLLV